MDDGQGVLPVLAIGEKTGAIQRLVQRLLREQLPVIHTYSPTEAKKHAEGQNAIIIADIEFLEARHLQWSDMTENSSRAVWLLLLPSGREDELADLLCRPSVFYALRSPWKEDEVRALVLRAAERSTLLQQQQELRRQTENLQKRLLLKKKSLSETRALGRLIHSEKMVILGQMVAGIAHELNTPLGVINAAVSNMSHHLRELMQSVEDFKRAGMGQADLNRIIEVIEEMLSALNGGQRRSSGEIRATQKHLMDILEQQKIRDSRRVAKDIARMELSEYTDVLLDLSAIYGSDTLFTFLTHCNRIISSTRDIHLSIEMLIRIVRALKNYSYPKSETLELVDIHSSLETAVVLLHNKFKHHIRIETHWGDIPEVWCYPGDLSQVWINIINNAIQAIEADGHIEIDTFQTPEYVGVRISDTGNGIPAEIQSRIFDIDFTTKSRNEGTGLGLYIARQIIEKHQGSITVDSVPGQTIFEVLLPFKPAS